MSKRLICLICFVLTRSLILTNPVQADLIGWWRLDEGSGTTAFDSSGNGNDATFQGAPVWIDNGKFGKAIQFNGTSDYLVAPDSDSLDIKGDQLSIAAWVNRDVSGGTRHVVRKVADSGTGAIYMIRIQSEAVRAILNTGGADITVQGATATALNQWVHIALVYDGTEARVYVDGTLDGTTSLSGAIAESNNELRIGRGEPAGYLQGMIDDVRLYNHALTEAELLSVIEGGGVSYPSARSPNPADGALVEATWVNLMWNPGDFAVTHNVYLGDNFEDVDNGTSDTFRGNQGETSILVGFPNYPFPNGLNPGTTYYWRIDEVNDADPNSPWKGDIWSFSIPPKTAYNPDPTNGAEFVDPNTALSWTGGYGSTLHTVYFGDNFNDVNDATGGQLLGTASYTPPDPFEREKVIYWRVDEFDGFETHKGDIWAFTTPGAVGNPKPANSAVDVQMTTTLSWTAADNAVSHELYFGTDAEAVRNATTTSPEYVGPRALGAESYDPGGLEWNSSYAWRVDEVYPTGTVKGLVWTFTTADFILVDDFESYNDIDPPDPNSNTIYSNWIDGYLVPTNGALTSEDLPPYAEQSIVHGGNQSMKFQYDTNMMISESTLTLVYPKDWTEQGVTKLSLWFRGSSANIAERMFVALNGNAVVYSDDPAASQIPGWNEWIIDLQKFADQGMNLANVNSITIGFGTKNTPTAGGAGTVYFDDIRLY